MVFCASEDWRRIVQEEILPTALHGVALGDDAIEIGPGPGFTTDVLCTMTAHLTAVEVDERLAASLADRLARWERRCGDRGCDRTGVPRRPFHGGGLVPHAPSRGTGGTRKTASSPSWPGCSCPVASSWRPTPATWRRRSLFHEGDTYNPIDAEDLDGKARSGGLRRRRRPHLRPRVGLHGPRPLTSGPEMIAGRAPLPDRDHLVRLTMIVADLGRCAIEPVGPNPNNSGTTPAVAMAPALGTSMAGAAGRRRGWARPAPGEGRASPRVRPAPTRTGAVHRRSLFSGMGRLLTSTRSSMAWTAGVSEANWR